MSERKSNTDETKSIYDLLNNTTISDLVDRLARANIRLTKESDTGRRCITAAPRHLYWTPLKESCVGMVVVFRETTLDMPRKVNDDGPTTQTNVLMDVVSIMPVRPIKLKNDDSQIMREYKTYTVKEIEDGSVLGLYYYCGQWCVRTLQSHDSTDMTWNGDITFGAVIKNIEERYPSFTMDELDKSHCYTIGIKHTQLHPFLEGRPKWDNDIVRAWFIESVDLEKIKMGATIKYSTCYHDESMGLPEMKTLKMSLKELVKKQEGALANYLKTGRVFFGATISREGGTKYKMCSTLYRAIEYSFYDTQDMNKLISDHEFNRQNYIVLNTFMYPNESEHVNFLRLFPQYTDDFNRFAAILKRLNAALFEMIKAGETIYGGNSETTDNKLFAGAVNTLYKNMVRISKGVPKEVAIIEICTRRTFNSRILYNLMFEDAAPPAPASESIPEPAAGKEYQPAQSPTPAST